MRGPIGPRRLEAETQRLFIKNTELACGQWWSYDVTAQALEAGSVVGHDAGCGVKGEPTRGKTERPALNALLRINKAAANALPSSFTRPNDALHGRCSKGCQERFVFQERIDAVLL